MIGKKLSKETRQKMSQSRKGKHPNRKNDYLTLWQAKLVKESLVQGKTTRQICDEINVPYKGVNSILSNIIILLLLLKAGKNGTKIIMKIERKD